MTASPGRPDFNDASWKTAPPALGAWALWNGSTNPDGFVGQMWMRTTVTLTPEQAAKPGAVLDLGVGQRGGRDLGQWQGSWARRPSPIARSIRFAPGVLKAGVNVITTNIFCSWRNCGIRGAADTRAHPLRRRHERAAVESVEISGSVATISSARSCRGDRCTA